MGGNPRSIHPTATQCNCVPSPLRLSLPCPPPTTTTTIIIIIISVLTCPLSRRHVYRLVFTDGVTRQQDEDKAETGTDEHMVAADNVGTRDLATLANLDEKTILSELKLRYGMTAA